MDRVLTAMSGGVDSAVAAFLVAQAYSADGCAGATMYLAGDNLSDAEDAAAAARVIGMPFFTFDLKAAFRADVMIPFAASYRCGDTPNPCVLCNRYIKFGKFIELARERGYNKIATGHYVRLSYNTPSRRFLISKGRDRTKDQSYFLYTLTQEQMSCVLFPLGDMTKDDVRRVAAENLLPSASKGESQDICFAPDGDYAAFIERMCGIKSECGDFTDAAGNIIGRHRGIEHYTTGQRRGLGISSREPLYVLSKDAATNRVVLGRNDDLFTKSLTAKRINIIVCDKIDRQMRVTAKIRSRHTEQSAIVEQISDDRIHVEFDEPQRAVTRGQSVVLYDGDIVVGGGVIE
ncbi:MAG: tRNA 2-thiouridine(34) synthase MnmA [Synergistes sp.]|nr:tRNA 2-thiouridine(34) synthase MnmA [Synergistes sp.]